MKRTVRSSVLIGILIFTFLSLPARNRSEDKKPAPKPPVKVEVLPTKPAHERLGIGLRLYGGLGYIGGGDINPGLSGSLDLWGAFIFPGSTIRTGGYKPVHAGFNGGVDILVFLQANWGISLGVDYLKASRTSEIQFSYGVEYTVFTTSPQVSAIPLKLGLFVEKPLGKKINLVLHGGGAYYLARFRYELSLSSPGDWGTITAATSANSIGFHGGAAIELEFSKNLFFFMEALGRYARIKGFTGTETIEGDSDPSESAPATIYFLNANSDKGRFHMLIPAKEFPDNPDYSEVREAVVDFSGFSARAGLRIKF
jgi:hypothetical protein